MADRNRRLQQAQEWAPNDNDLRQDGTRKGRGWLGSLPTHDGGVMTEKSLGIEADGKQHEIPAIVPTLDKDEIDHLGRGGEPTDAIVNKAFEHARQRVRAGRSPYRQRYE